MSRFKLHLCILSCCLFTLSSTFLTTSSARAAEVYYRVASLMSFNCIAFTDYVRMEIGPRIGEWANIPVGATAIVTIFINGAKVASVSTELTPGSGSQTSAESYTLGESYPFSLLYQIETVVGGEVVYVSSYSATCLADGPTTGTLVNMVPSTSFVGEAFSGPALPADHNLVAFIRDTPVYSIPDGAPTGNSIRTCQTVFVLETSADGEWGRIFVMGGWIPLSATVDVAEDYGQSGGQARLPGCESQ
jgi:uncharacterized membrane protein